MINVHAARMNLNDEDGEFSSPIIMQKFEDN